MLTVFNRYRIKKSVVLLPTLFLFVGCAGSHSASTREAMPAASTATPISPALVVPLSEINLAEIGAIAPKGRVQDRDYNQLPVIEQLISHGKESVPYLIGKIEDESKVKGHVMDYWSDVRVGDVAFLILTDFFTDATWQRATIPDAAWCGFLGCGNDKNLTGEQALRRCRRVAAY